MVFSAWWAARISDFGVTGGAALASSSRGSSWWLGARWLAVGGGIGRWRAAERTCVFLALWRRACCGAYPLFIARARFEFSRSRVFIASFGHRDRPSPLQLRATCCRIRLRLFRHAATSVLRGLPAFYRSGAFCAFPAFLSSRLAFGADGVGHGTAGRAAVGICVDRRDAEAAGGGVVGSCGRTAPLRARAFGGFLSPPAWIEVHIVASQCWKTVRVRPSVCSPARLGGSLVICCALRAVGRRFCVARGPSSCGGRGTSWWALRTGRLLFNIVGWSMLLTGNQAGIFPLFGAPLPSLCRPRGCGVRSRRGGQGSAALCGRL